jgi:hypothetical protein
MKVVYRTVVIFVVVVLMQQTAYAQFGGDKRLLVFDASYALVISGETGHELNGYAFAVSYEQVMHNGSVAWGVAIGYLNSQEDIETEEAQTVNFQTLPFSLFGKYLFGSQKIKGFIKGGFGLHSSKVEFSDPSNKSSDWDSGILLDGGLGVYLSFDRKIFATLGYDFTWMSQSFYQDGMGHLFSLGLGFSFD